jgi:hypothetical protein
MLMEEHETSHNIRSPHTTKIDIQIIKNINVYMSICVYTHVRIDMCSFRAFYTQLFVLIQSMHIKKKDH